MNLTLTGVMVSFDYYPEHETASRCPKHKEKLYPKNPKQKEKDHYFKIQIQA